MRFIVILKATKESEAGTPPDPKEIDEMVKYNGEIARGGILLAAEGLMPSTNGARVRFSGTKRSVVDGPFTESKELVAGFWILQVRSKEEAVEVVKRFPNPLGKEFELEIRQAWEFDSSGPEFQPDEQTAKNAGK